MQTLPLTLMNIENSTNNIPKNNTNEYVPGKCNLGYEEIYRRKRNVLRGLILTILGITALQLLNTPSIWRFLLFMPLSYVILCYYQAQQKFCVAFGIFGIYNFLEIGKVTKVSEPEYKIKDKLKAWLIILKSFLLALIIVVVYYFLPI